MTEMNHNQGPYPSGLHRLVQDLKYKAGWSFEVKWVDRGQGSVGLTLVIRILCADSYHSEKKRGVLHYFPVLPAAYDDRSWQRWLLERILDVERHEAMEFFTIDGVKPYAPSHGPGNNPYMIREVGTDVDRRTSFRGEISEK